MMGAATPLQPATVEPMAQSLMMILMEFAYAARIHVPLGKSAIRPMDFAKHHATRPVVLERTAGPLVTMNVMMTGPVTTTVP